MSPIYRLYVGYIRPIHRLSGVIGLLRPYALVGVSFEETDYFIELTPTSGFSSVAMM